MYRAAVVGSGRIGCGGFGTPFIYSHIDAYRAFPDRVEVVGICDTDWDKAKAAQLEHGIKTASRDIAGLASCAPDIVSVCTPPHERAAIIDEIVRELNPLALWVEKPLAQHTSDASLICNHDIPMQVNYIRRFDAYHQMIKDGLEKEEMGKIQWMRCLYSGGMANNGAHFVDLARFWGIALSRVQLVETDGWDGTVTEVELVGTKGKVHLYEGGMRFQTWGPMDSEVFPKIRTWQPLEWPYRKDHLLGETAYPPHKFMENALENLLNHLDHGEELICPADEALETLLFAKQIAIERGLKW